MGRGRHQGHGRHGSVRSGWNPITVWFGRMRSPTRILEADRPRFIDPGSGASSFAGRTATFEPDGNGTLLTQEFRTQGIIPAIAARILATDRAGEALRRAGYLRQDRGARGERVVSPGRAGQPAEPGSASTLRRSCRTLRSPSRARQRPPGGGGSAFGVRHDLRTGRAGFRVVRSWWSWGPPGCGSVSRARTPSSLETVPLTSRTFGPISWATSSGRRSETHGRAHTTPDRVGSGVGSRNVACRTRMNQAEIDKTLSHIGAMLPARNDAASNGSTGA